MTVSPSRLVTGVLAAGAVALLAAVLVARQGEVLARGNLLPVFDGYEVERVRIWGLEVYVDRSAGAGDLLTAAALAFVALLLLIGARRLHDPVRRTFATAGWGAAFLAADDALSAHETIGHNLLFLARLPVIDHPDDAVVAFYALVVAAFAWRHRALAAGATAWPWQVAGACAALAVAHDVSPLHLGPVEETLEVLAACAALIGVAELARRHTSGPPEAAVERPGAVTPHTLTTRGDGRFGP